MSGTSSPISHLRSECPELHISEDPFELKEFGKDWTKVFTPNPSAVVFPRNREEIQHVIRWANQTRTPIVPSGGRTGLAGGAVARNQEVVLSLAKMNAMGRVDPMARTLRVEAGAITQAVHEHTRPHGLTWPVDFASKGSSHVGGNIATNAGGIHVLRYGLTRQWVLGLEVVTGNGDFLNLNGALEKNNTGTDLRQLFIGSEGILGVVTAATLKLAPLPKEVQVFLFAVDSLGDVLELFGRARRSGFVLQAFEFFTERCLERVKRNLGVRSPFSRDYSHYVVLEIEKPTSIEATDAWLSELLESGLAQDGTFAQSNREAEEIWTYREGISESLSSTGTPHKNDISLPIHSLRGFCGELDRFFEEHYPDWEICNFGHIGDGNLHINVMKPDSLSMEEFKAKTHLVDRDLFTLVQKHGGSISAEHGIGLLKKDFLHFTRSPTEIALFRGLKKVFDPNGILNPGKVFE